jgi:hypothetical protein
MHQKTSLTEYDFISSRADRIPKLARPWHGLDLLRGHNDFNKLSFVIGGQKNLKHGDGPQLRPCVHLRVIRMLLSG